MRPINCMSDISEPTCPPPNWHASSNKCLTSSNKKASSNKKLVFVFLVDFFRLLVFDAATDQNHAFPTYTARCAHWRSAQHMSTCWSSVMAIKNEKMWVRLSFRNWCTRRAASDRVWSKVFQQKTSQLLLPDQTWYIKHLEKRLTSHTHAHTHTPLV